MYFQYYQALYLLIFIIPIVWLLKRSEKRIFSIASVYKVKPPGAWFFNVKLVLVVLFISSIILIAARPYIVSNRSADYVFLIDVSRSMDARQTCGDLTFLDRSKIIMRDVLSGTPEARFGIFAFDRFAFPISQMTNDFDYLNDVIEEGVHIGLTFEATKTELANALGVIADKKSRLPDIYGTVSKVILISDGNVSGDYRRRISEPLTRLRNSGVQVLTIGIGNPGETPIKVRERGQCVNDNIELDGETVLIPLRDDVLKFIASESQGIYFAEGETERLIETLRAGLEIITDTPDSEEDSYRKDISIYFLVFASLALFGLFLLRLNLKIDQYNPHS